LNASSKGIEALGEEQAQSFEEHIFHLNEVRDLKSGRITRGSLGTHKVHGKLSQGDFDLS